MPPFVHWRSLIAQDRGQWLPPHHQDLPTALRQARSDIPHRLSGSECRDKEGPRFGLKKGRSAARLPRQMLETLVLRAIPSERCPQNCSTCSYVHTPICQTQNATTAKWC